MANWSLGEIEKLRALIIRGLPFSKIAEILGRTRNACIGRSHRLDDLPKVEKPVKVKPPKKEKAAKPNKGNIIMFPKPKAQRRPKNKRLTILDLEFGQCRYPIAEDDGIHLFCGEEAVGSYCQKHHALSYVKRGASRD